MIGSTVLMSTTVHKTFCWMFATWIMQIKLKLHSKIYKILKVNTWRRIFKRFQFILKVCHPHHSVLGPSIFLTCVLCEYILYSDASVKDTWSWNDNVLSCVKISHLPSRWTNLSIYHLAYKFDLSCRSIKATGSQIIPWNLCSLCTQTFTVSFLACLFFFEKRKSYCDHPVVVVGVPNPG